MGHSNRLVQELSILNDEGEWELMVAFKLSNIMVWFTEYYEKNDVTREKRKT